ncbi:MAG: hypothetical protein WC220_13925, partial [Pedobacter sp.]
MNNTTDLPLRVFINKVDIGCYRRIYVLCNIIGILLIGFQSNAFASSKHRTVYCIVKDSVASKNIVDIGSRLELFLDNYLIEKFVGKAEQRMHQPVPKEIVLTHNEPWEGSGSAYHSIFKDGNIYRMYYKAWQLTVSENMLKTDTHPLWTCYAESDDGIHWRKPELGLFDFQGSKANNIVMTSDKIGNVSADGGHNAVFKDENPDASPMP